MQLLPYIKDDIFLKEVKKVLDVNKNDSRKNKSIRNSIDPFSAIFDASIQSIPINLWFELEVRRQSQKTLQNKLGLFHQNILGHVSGWSNLNTGKVVDLLNTKKKIIAEIKNKFNTTKGSDKVQIYDNIKFLLDTKYKGYVGYYVEVIPQNKKVYDSEFTPSDNKIKKRRPRNKNIRIIDGSSFYDLATGYNDSLFMLYMAIPEAITKILKIPVMDILGKNETLELYKEAYQIK